MSNSNTPHSRQLRQTTAAARIKRCKEDGVRVNVLLFGNDAKLAKALIEKHGTKTEMVKRLLKLENEK
jgi:hypothetical protein